MALTALPDAPTVPDSDMPYDLIALAVRNLHRKRPHESEDQLWDMVESRVRVHKQLMYLRPCMCPQEWEQLYDQKTGVYAVKGVSAAVVDVPRSPHVDAPKAPVEFPAFQVPVLVGPPVDNAWSKPLEVPVSSELPVVEEKVEEDEWEEVPHSNEQGDDVEMRLFTYDPKFYKQHKKVWEAGYNLDTDVKMKVSKIIDACRRGAWRYNHEIDDRELAAPDDPAIPRDCVACDVDDPDVIVTAYDEEYNGGVPQTPYKCRFTKRMYFGERVDYGAVWRMPPKSPLRGFATAMTEKVHAMMELLPYGFEACQSEKSELPPLSCDQLYTTESGKVLCFRIEVYYRRRLSADRELFMMTDKVGM